MVPGNSINTNRCSSCRCRLRVHRGGGAATSTATTSAAAAAAGTQRLRSASRTPSGKIRHSAGCISELVPHPSTDALHKPPARRSVDGRLQTTAGPTTSATSTTNIHPSTTTDSGSTTAGGTGSQQADVTSHAVPTIVITSSTSSHDHAEHDVSKTSTKLSDVTGLRGGGSDVSKSGANQQEARSSTSSSSTSSLKSVERPQRKSCDDYENINSRKSSNYLDLIRDKVSPPSTTRTMTSPQERRRHQFRRPPRSERL